MKESLFYLDAGTTWSKILELRSDGEKKYQILPSSDIKNLDLKFNKVTGHNFSFVQKEDYVNEVVALSLGAIDRIDKNGIVLDLGSRDIKWVKFKDSKFSDMDWNTSCGAATGATVEMLMKFYNVNSDSLMATKEKYSITCGIFGLEKIMDDISNGLSSQNAISKFIHGIAYNAYEFTKRPETIYISGGFCINKCFIDCLSYYCTVVPLGRFVLVDGLIKS